MNKPIYLDYNATTPVDQRVLDKMLPYLKECFGNSSSMTHGYGWEANQAVETARKQVATLIGCADKPKTVIWTSGATESNNMALLGAIRPYLEKGEKVHLITTQIEHKAVLDVAKHLEKHGAEVTYLAPDRFGQISANQVRAAIKPHTKLISIIMGQNEVGTINPIREIGQVAKEFNILFHVDGAQTVGKMPINVNDLNIDMLSASGHKLYAPKGIGFLYIRAGVSIDPLMFGGSQEFGLRPGTVNVPCVVAMGAACQLAGEVMIEESERLTAMRDQLINKVLSAAHCARLNGHPTERLCSNVSLSFEGLSSDIFALNLAGLALSSGSACSAGAPSYVLSALGVPESLARATLRIGIGRFTTQAELDLAADKIVTMLKKHTKAN